MTLATIPSRQDLSWLACSFCLSSQETLKASSALVVVVEEHPAGSWEQGDLWLSHLLAALEYEVEYPGRVSEDPRGKLPL